MSQPAESFQPWVIFRLKDQRFALSSEVVQEMLALPEVTPLPNAADHVRGMINLRGQVLPLLDLRRRMNLPSSLAEMEELVEMLHQREEDHKAYLQELEASVQEKRKFTKTTDPHQCAFGQWYDGFSSDNLELMGILKKFDRPHRRIHAIAAEVDELNRAGEYDQAFALIQRTRDTSLARMVELFEEVRRAVRRTHREIAMVLERGGEAVAVAVDQVESVEELSQGTVEEVPAGFGAAGDRLIAMIGRRQENDQMVLILDVEALLSEGAFAAQAAPAAAPEGGGT
jgi:purine-binding chemotaxis protein CheW